MLLFKLVAFFSLISRSLCAASLDVDSRSVADTIHGGTLMDGFFKMFNPDSRLHFVMVLVLVIGEVFNIF